MSTIQGAAGTPFENVKASKLLAYWPFVGTLQDVSTNARGPALVQGDNVQLALQNAGYISVRRPGFINLPVVDIRTINFAIDMNLRLLSVPSSRQTLLSNWAYANWQHWLSFDLDGTLIFNLRRNLQVEVNNPTQELAVIRMKPPVGRFFNLVCVYDKTRRKVSCYIDGALAGSQTVAQDVTDLTLHAASQQYMQFGNKADDTPVTGSADADLCQLKFYELTC